MSFVFDAIQQGDLKTLTHYIKSGNKCSIRGPSKWTLLHAAIAANELHMVELLIHQPDIPINGLCSDGKSPLMLASEIDDIDIEILKCLLDAGADVNLGNESGVTPLHVACRNMSLHTTNIFLKYNADVNAKDFDGYTPLHYVALNNSIETLDMLIQNRNVSSDWNIDATDNDGCTALMLAIDVCNIEIATALIKFGANVNIIGRGTTALHLSVITQQPQLFMQLWCKTDFSIIVHLSESNNLLKLMIKYGWFFSDRLPCLFLLLDEPGVKPILCDRAKLFTTLFYRLRFVKNVHEIDICSITKKFLERGVSVKRNDLRAFIQNFSKLPDKFSLLETLVYEGKANFDSRDLIIFTADFHPQLIPILLPYSIHTDITDIYEHFIETFQITYKLLQLLKYSLYLHTPSPTLRKQCKVKLLIYGLNDFITGNESVASLHKNVLQTLSTTMFPTLTELCRNKVRNLIKNHCQNSYEFMSAINELDWPLDVIDIIQYKSAVHL